MTDGLKGRRKCRGGEVRRGGTYADSQEPAPVARESNAVGVRSAEKAGHSSGILPLSGGATGGGGGNGCASVLRHRGICWVYLSKGSVFGCVFVAHVVRLDVCVCVCVCLLSTNAKTPTLPVAFRTLLVVLLLFVVILFLSLNLLVFYHPPVCSATGTSFLFKPPPPSYAPIILSPKPHTSLHSTPTVATPVQHSPLAPPFATDPPPPPHPHTHPSSHTHPHPPRLPRPQIPRDPSSQKCVPKSQRRACVREETGECSFSSDGVRPSASLSL